LRSNVPPAPRLRVLEATASRASSLKQPRDDSAQAAPCVKLAISPQTRRYATTYIGVIDDTGFRFFADERSDACGRAAKQWKCGQSAAVECKWRTEPQCLGSPTAFRRCSERSAERKADEAAGRREVQRPTRCRRPSVHRCVAWVGRPRLAPTGLPSRTSRRRRRASGRCRPCSPAAGHRGHCRSRLRL